MSGDERSDLRQTFEKLWEEIRGGQLYAGQPRNAQSSTGVALAHEALRLATEANDENLLLFREAAPLAEEYRRAFVRLWERKP